jgi:hypothetical protein
MDFLARKKVSLTMSYTILDSLPFPRLDATDSITVRLSPLVLRLTCTGSEMLNYWNAMSQLGWVEPARAISDVPFLSNADDRLAAVAEIEAIVAREIYGLSRDEVDYIMETFPIVKRKDIAAHGNYRTKETILEIYDAMAEATQTGVPYRTRLDPPPADPRVAHPPRRVEAMATRDDN